MDIKHWLETKQNHIASITLILLTSILVMIASANFNGEYKWDGLIYSILVKKYLLTFDLSSLQISDLPEWAHHIPIQSYFNRVSYYWTAKFLYASFPLKDNLLFLMLDFIPFTIAAVFFYFTGYRYLSLNKMASLFASIWLLIVPPAKIGYEVLAHPEPLCLMFMSMAMYFSLGSRHTLAAFLLLFGIMTRESVAMLAIFLACYHFLFNMQKESHVKRFFPPLLYLAAMLIGLGLPACIQKSSSFSSFSYLLFVLDMNRHFGLVYLLNNFSIIWIPYVIGFTQLESRLKLCHSIALLLGCILLVAAVDWWRVLYGNLYFAVLPIAALTIQRFFKQNALYVFLFISFVLFSFPAWVNFEKLKDPDLWPYYCMLALFFAQTLINKYPSFMSHQDIP